jgi:Fur family transcriptional regulator, ferric uptake regulator
MLPGKVSKVAPTSMRITRQRAAVLATLGSADGFVSAQDLHALIRRRRGRVGLSTVYRTLSTLSDAGQVHVIRSESGESLFGHCSPADSHHHHLRCRRCGRTTELSNDGLEEWVESVGNRHGFTNLTHECEVHGLCPACSTTKAGNDDTEAARDA